DAAGLHLRGEDRIPATRGRAGLPPERAPESYRALRGGEGSPELQAKDAASVHRDARMGGTAAHRVARVQVDPNLFPLLGRTGVDRSIRITVISTPLPRTGRAVESTVATHARRRPRAVRDSFGRPPVLPEAAAASDGHRLRRREQHRAYPGRVGELLQALTLLR
ncbi:hypothetical protein ACH4LD_42825, partial [Streptomyces sp. NPDC017676]